MKICIPLEGRVRTIIRSSFLAAKRTDATHYSLTGETFQMSGVKAEQVILLPDDVSIAEGEAVTDELLMQALPIESFIVVSAEEALPNALGLLLRLAVADAMRRSWTRPLASAGRPVFMDPLIKHRQNSPLRPGITLYFARALALALAESPECAGYLVGENILSPKTIDIGIAAQVADGVMVPVLRRVNERTMEELLEDYNRLIAQARRRRLAPEDSTGGIATVTNFGGFGLTFAAPMPMPSESIILGVGAVTKTPVWSDEVEAFIPISKANIVATGDHRVVDGADIGRLLKRVAELLQRPEYL